MGDRLVPVHNEDGTTSTISAVDLDARDGYLDRIQREGVTWSLICGCRGKRLCGYHDEQAKRVTNE